MTQAYPETTPLTHGALPVHVDGEIHVHALPKWILLAVYAALLVLTAITVAVSRLDLGQFNIWVALFVAVVKGSLVALFFMHLWWDSKFNGLILIAAFFFVALFIGLALLDSVSYQPNLKATPMSMQR